MKRIAHIVSARSGEDRGVPDSARSEGFAVDIVSPRATAFPSSAIDLMLTEVATVEAALRAQAGGYDAILIGSTSDYAIEAIRSAVSIPAIGCGQASILTAAALGRRCAIVTIWPQSTAQQYDAILAASGMRDRCASVRYVSTDAEMTTLDDADSFYTQMRAGRQHMIDRIAAEMRAAVDEDGADTIVLGCNCMTPVAPMLAGGIEVPVVDPTAAGYRFVSMLLASGLSHSPQAFPPAQRDRSRLFSDVVDTARAALDRDDPNAQECEVCALSEDGGSRCGASPAIVT